MKKDKHSIMQDLAGLIDFYIQEQTGTELGFILTIFGFNDAEDIAGYVSNTKREDVLHALDLLRKHILKDKEAKLRWMDPEGSA